MRIKVCGMTRTDQLHRLEELGVTFAGLIFYPRSPRFVGKFSLTAADIKKEKLNINKVGVFVNATEEEVLRTVDEWRLQMVQLHGDETVKYCERISNHVNTIKAFRVMAVRGCNSTGRCSEMPGSENLSSSAAASDRKTPPG
jgi:phosphoribosylanthranilate isomerase